MTELNYGVMADYWSEDTLKHVGLAYYTNGTDYIIYTVVGVDQLEGYRYWAQYDTKEEAVEDYDREFVKLFPNR